MQVNETRRYEMIGDFEHEPSVVGWEVLFQGGNAAVLRADIQRGVYALCGVENPPSL